MHQFFFCFLRITGWLWWHFLQVPTLLELVISCLLGRRFTIEAIGPKNIFIGQQFKKWSWRHNSSFTIDYFYFKVPNCSTAQRTIYKKINEIFNDTTSPGFLLGRADPCSTISYYDLVFKFQHEKYLCNCARVGSQN